MSKLEWQLVDADEPSVVNLGLPVTGDVARSLLRGEGPLARLLARVTKRGRFADLLGLGWPGLYAVSPRMVSAIDELAGISLVPVEIESGPKGYAVLGVTGRCGSVDYRRSKEVGRMDEFVQLRGLHVDEPKDVVDFAVPANRETVLIGSHAADLVRAAGLDNIQLLPLDEVEFYISQRLLSTYSQG